MFSDDIPRMLFARIFRLTITGQGFGFGLTSKRRIRMLRNWKTGHPFGFSFSGTELKSHYAVLLEHEKMDAFVRVQYMDHGLMFSMGLSLFILAVIVTRNHKVDSFLQPFGFVGGLIFPLSTSMDAIENVFLLVMLSNPLEFSNWLGIAYSSFASAKLSLFFIGAVWLIIATIALRVKIRFLLVRR